MRGKDLLEQIGLAEISYVEEADEAVPKKKRHAAKYAVIAACFLVIASAVGVPLAVNQGTRHVTDTGTDTRTTTVEQQNENGYIVKHLPYGQDQTEYSDRRLPYWNEMTDAQRYAEVAYENLTYTTRLIAVHEENIGQKLGRATASGFDFYTDEVHTLTGTVYSVKNIDTEAAICFRFGEDDRYAYAYVNADYRPNTLGDLISALNLHETLTTALVYDPSSTQMTVDEDGNISATQTVVYEDIPTETVWEMLLDDTELPCEAEVAVRTNKTRMSISVSVDLLGYHNVSLSVTEDGYLWTNILDTAKYFNIGTDKANAFIEEVERHQGYLYVYDLLTECDE